MAIEIISTLKPKNNGTFPIAEAKDITVDENGTRLDAKLTELANNSGGSGGGGSYVLELTAESGTLTDEQYNAVVANAPNVVAKVFGGEALCKIVAYADGVIYVFQSLSVVDGYEIENCTELSQITVTVNADKTYSVAVDGATLPNKDYVDNAVANAGGGSGGGIIDVTELPTEEIDESALYRVPIGTMIFNDYIQPTDVYIVNTLPAEGVVVSGDGQNMDAVYYNTADGVLYGYLSETLAAGLNATAGWLTMDALFTALGYQYGGVVASKNDATENGKFYLILEHRLCYYKNKWLNTTKDTFVIRVSPELEVEKSLPNLAYEEIYNNFPNTEIRVHFNGSTMFYYLRPANCDDYSYIYTSIVYDVGAGMVLAHVLKVDTLGKTCTFKMQVIPISI